MKLRFEERGFGEDYTQKKHPSVVKKNSWATREYKVIGYTLEPLNKGQRFIKTLKLIGLMSLNIPFIFTPFAFHKYRKEIKNTIREIKTGKEKINHAVPFFSENEKKSVKNILEHKLTKINNFLNNPDPSKRPVAFEIFVKSPRTLQRAGSRK